MDQASMKKILIVEDDKDFMWILRQSFSNVDVIVVAAEDGEDGLAKAESEKPDLMLIDIDLPKLNGIEMAKAIREKGLAPMMIFLTNLKDADHVSEAIDVSGQADYLVKADTKVDAIVDVVKNKLGLT